MNGLVVEGFLEDAGWGGAAIAPLAGDASTRRYQRLTRPDGARAVVMQAPIATEADRRSLLAFQRMAGWLTAQGLSAPRILAGEPAAGLLVLEDLGDGSLSGLLSGGSAAALTAYRVAARIPDTLTALPVPDWIATPGIEAQVDMIALTLERLPDPGRLADLKPALTEAMARHCDGPASIALRDYHGDNLMWLPDRSGDARIGLLDFQDAVALPFGYDLASLVDDVRREVPESLRQKLVEEFAARHGLDAAAAQSRIAVLSALRNLRILGVFDRLAAEADKPLYRRFIPRTWALIDRALSDPALTGLRSPVAELRRQSARWCPA